MIIVTNVPVKAIGQTGSIMKTHNHILHRMATDGETASTIWLVDELRVVETSVVAAGFTNWVVVSKTETDIHKTMSSLIKHIHIHTFYDKQFKL